MKLTLSPLLLGLGLLANCSSVPSADFWPSGVAQHNGMRYTLIGIAISTPPANNIIFGPCNDEFGMPDSRRENCNVYYFIRGRESPWAQKAAAAQANAYPPQNLYCQRTVGGLAECMVIRGAAHAPLMMAPNMGSN
jgi:hypothetical protein